MQSAFLFLVIVPLNKASEPIAEEQITRRSAVVQILAILLDPLIPDMSGLFDVNEVEKLFKILDDFSALDP